MVDAATHAKGLKRLTRHGGTHAKGSKSVATHGRTYAKAVQNSLKVESCQRIATLGQNCGNSVFAKLQDKSTQLHSR